MKLQPIPEPGNLGSPLWCSDNRIYFVSDYEGTGCLYSCDLEGNDLQRHSEPSGVLLAPVSTVVDVAMNESLTVTCRVLRQKSFD